MIVLFVLFHPFQDSLRGDSADVTSEDVAKSGGGESVNEKIGARVKGHQTMGNGGGAKCPEAEAVAVTFNSLAKDVQGQELVNIKDKTEGMTKKKEENNDKEDDGLLRFIGLFLLRCHIVTLRPVHQLTAPFHHPIYAVVEKAQANERNDALHQKPCDVDVDHDVSVVQAELGRGCPAPVDLYCHVALYIDRKK